MSVVTLTMNGRLISARQGESLLQAAREHGIEIPTLCHLDGLEPLGGCRLCLVEVRGSPRPLPACLTQASEGLVVETDTAALVEYRRMIVELLLAERAHTCSVCVRNGRCELQAMAARLGVDHVRFEYRYRLLPLDASHERFTLDHNRCILCRRCVRVCDAVEGAHTWDVCFRGINGRVVSDLDRPWGESTSCTGCGKCVHLCPTGALSRTVDVGDEAARERASLLRILERRAGIREEGA